jgi:hypothetical protein
MTAIRWQILVSSVAVILILALGSLIVSGERARIPRDHSSLAIRDDTPERSWEASAGKESDLVNLELGPTVSSEPIAPQTVAAGAGASEK